MTLWIVKHDNHDYDVMSEWYIGAFSTKEKADAASLADCERYWKANPGSQKKGFPNVDIIEMELDEVIDNG